MGEDLGRRPNFHKRFIRYKEICLYLNHVQKLNPRNARVETIGHSVEGRPIDMIVMGRRVSEQNKIGIFIDANIHAREWISCSTLLTFIEHLTLNPYLLNIADFYLVPCLNPDGYEYCHTHNRLWRKNRNNNGSRFEAFQGVDLNRNFPYAFGRNVLPNLRIHSRLYILVDEGSSANKKMFDYRGEYPLSEPESKALAYALEKYKHCLKMYLSIHCFGNLIMYPWGFTKKALYDERVLYRCADVCRLAMRRYRNRLFVIGSTANELYLTSGSSTDYARGVVNIKFSFTIELQSFGKSGFTAPVTKIMEIGKETSGGILAMVRFVVAFYAVKQMRKEKKLPHFRKCKKKFIV